MMNPAADDIKSRINQAVQKRNAFVFIVDFELKEGLFIDNPFDSNLLFWRFGKQTNANHLSIDSNGTQFRPKAIPFSDYSKAFDRVYRGLSRGDTFLTNLTQRTPIDMDYSLQELFLKAQSPYAIYLPNRFVCFSPERFVRIENGNIYSNPMKGTIEATSTKAEKKLRTDPKEQAEHATIVDLIRSDLSRVASNVRVNRNQYIDRIETSQGAILQMSSEISGKLLPEYIENIGDCLFQLLPAGSISGAPKTETLEIIRQAEQIDRGFYCGIAGYFDGKTLDSCVMIRFIEEDNNHKFFRSGGGITINSNVQKEYQEIQTKIYRPFQ